MPLTLWEYNLIIAVKILIVHPFMAGLTGAVADETIGSGNDSSNEQKSVL